MGIKFFKLGVSMNNFSLRQMEKRDERLLVSPFRDMFEYRIVFEFLIVLFLWVSVLALGIAGIIPLWLGLCCNTVLATTFYMPMHEATHGNIWGRHSRYRWGEDLIGSISSLPLGFDYWTHRIQHMRHHAFTNDPKRDPDYHTKGPIRELPVSWWGIAVISTFTPVFAFSKHASRFLPSKIRNVFANQADTDVPKATTLKTGKYALRFWIFMHSILIAAFIFGFVWEFLLLWYLPARISNAWLILVFAWYPHHPAEKQGRYVDTRVAVFPGSTLLIRGHDHHALHHLFPRVPHYRLPKLWKVIGPQMTAKGVRTEGRAVGANTSIVWN
ncbi:MAG: hypothetical protein CL425_06705 [Acidimicrobiaceae bacterium]|nr:hypothetical protein [Acidimicrobiaceae bacterium]